MAFCARRVAALDRGQPCCTILSASTCAFGVLIMVAVCAPPTLRVEYVPAKEACRETAVLLCFARGWALAGMGANQTHD